MYFRWFVLRVFFCFCFFGKALRCAFKFFFNLSARSVTCQDLNCTHAVSLLK